VKTFAGQTWCHECGRAPKVQGARILEAGRTNVLFSACHYPLYVRPKGVVTVMDERRA